MPEASVKTIHDILAQFRDEELQNRHLGDRFERLICRYRHVIEREGPQADHNTKYPSNTLRTSAHCI